MRLKNLIRESLPHIIDDKGEIDQDLAKIHDTDADIFFLSTKQSQSEIKVHKKLIAMQAIGYEWDNVRFYFLF